MMVRRKPSRWQDARAKRVGEFMHISYLEKFCCAAFIPLTYCHFCFTVDLAVSNSTVSASQAVLLVAQLANAETATISPNTRRKLIKHDAEFAIGTLLLFSKARLLWRASVAVGASASAAVA